MSLFQIVLLALVQGAAELLPVSSSAHVIVAEKLMGLDPTAPAMTMLLVMLHTGTMFAVIVYFWRDWRRTYFSSAAALRRNGLNVVIGTAATGIVGFGLMQAIKAIYLRSHPGFEIEHLFGNARLMATALAAAGLLILVSSRMDGTRGGAVGPRTAGWIGAVQGLCLPFRGFSRSGATISTGMALGVARRPAEEFSFALAVVLTPAVIVREAWRLVHHAAPDAAAHALAAPAAPGAGTLASMFVPGLIGMVFSFAAGLGALRWLSGWLEHGRWHWFGFYCLCAAAVVAAIG